MKTARKKKNDKKGKDIRYANMLQRSTNEYFQKLTAVYKNLKNTDEFELVNELPPRAIRLNYINMLPKQNFNCKFKMLR